MRQFFRADSDEMKALATSWKQRSWAQRWDGRFGGDGDFFGVPTNDAPVYVTPFTHCFIVTPCAGIAA